MRQRLAILGSTGSIGVQTLDIVRENPELFEARILTAGRRWELLAQQAREFDADAVVIADKNCYAPLRDALADTDTKVYAGEEAVAQVAAAGGTEVVVNALVGYAGLAPTIAALGAGKKLALANKESLVVGGEYVMRVAAEHRAPILPIDSEHSAIFQCLAGERSAPRRLIVTCSGGSLRDVPREALADVTPEQALRHPQWSMGAKITIDSATMLNKAFEIIEARWLFDVAPEKIEAVVHPQSIVHSMVEFVDGAVKAQLGIPDMHLPIRYALGDASRLPSEERPLSLCDYANLTFEKPDSEKFPCLTLAPRALTDGGNTACIINAANEVAVAAFLKGQISFHGIYDVITDALSHIPFISSPTLDDYVATHNETIHYATDACNTIWLKDMR